MRYLTAGMLLALLSIAGNSQNRRPRFEQLSIT